MATLNQLTIQQAAFGIRNKEFSVRELVLDCLAAIEKQDPQIHAYLDVYKKESLEQAEAADQMFHERRELPPLFGIPFAIKDVILIEGHRCTAGSKILENYTATYDATVIRKLKNHGAIFLGKTNLDEFAMGASTENSGFGPTRNPHDPERVPGGSSGGSAAAVAAHLALGALGSDTGGSIRQPASFCGIVGLKPTYGRVSRHGLIAMASSLDQIGPMTKSVGDAKIVYRAIAGQDRFDATSAPNDNSMESDSEDYVLDPKKIRVGVPREYFTSGLDPEVEKIIRAALKKLGSAGAKIKEIQLPYASYALPTYYIVVPSEVSANLARFDGIRYGHNSSHAETLFEVYAKSRAEGLGTEVKRRILIGTYALSAGYYDAYYQKAQQVRRLIRNDFKNAFEEVDIIIGPTAPTPAFRLGERAADPIQMYLADIYTVALNLAGLPGISVPAGWVERDNKKLPVGIQLISQWFCEKYLLDVATLVENLIAGV